MPPTTSPTPELKELAKSWLRWNSNENDGKQIETLVSQAKWGELDGRLSKRIAFGTAGLRSAMKAGFAHMNDLVVQQTSQGLFSYLQQELGDSKLKSSGVVIGFDGRHHSRDFACITAAVFISKGVKVYILSKTLAATPLVAFGVTHYGAAAGVMVTASHNPKQDNGYKVYWGNGCQIIPPHDRGISNCIDKSLEPWKIDIDERSVMESKLTFEATEEVADAYFKAIDSLCNTRTQNKEAKGVRLTYTAMHGVGLPWVKRAFEQFDLPPFHQVKEQVMPDPEFPTVTFPNPEEGKGALALAILTADAHESRVIIANDPDADRLAVAEKQASGSWDVFNGNEIGAMFAAWAWHCFLQSGPSPAQKSRAAMVTTAVSSKMIKAMADKEGFQFHETLTGFKWIGNKAIEVIGGGSKFLFGYEEAIGFMFGDTCFDKDGVRAAAVFSELVNYVTLQLKMTLRDYLQSLYAKYGFHCIQTKYYFCYDPKIMATIFTRLRTSGENGKYVWSCGGMAIKRIRDQTTGFDSAEPNERTKLPVDPKSQMVTYFFENGAVVTLRGSGTEPKLKYYVEVCGQPGQSETKVRELQKEVTAKIQAEFLQPEKNGLVPPAGSAPEPEESHAAKRHKSA